MMAVTGEREFGGLNIHYLPCSTTFAAKLASRSGIGPFLSSWPLRGSNTSEDMAPKEDPWQENMEGLSMKHMFSVAERCIAGCGKTGKWWTSLTEGSRMIIVFSVMAKSLWMTCNSHSSVRKFSVPLLHRECKINSRSWGRHQRLMGNLIHAFRAMWETHLRTMLLYGLDTKLRLTRQLLKMKCENQEPPCQIHQESVGPMNDL